jgi:large subunit ribosomal protein L5
MSEKSQKSEDKKAKPAREPKGKSSAKDSGAAKPVPRADAKPAGPSRLHAFYRDTVVKDLTQKFGYKSVMQVPRIDKIVLNMGVGEAVADKKIMDNAVADMTKIAGQKPLVTKSRKAIASFKIRENYPIGCKVTLRGTRMYDFLDRLVNVAMPRIRDFRGISGRSFDGMGNYNMGVKEQIIFPEIEYDKIDAIRGMNITISTTAKTDDEAKSLLAAFKFPFRN